MPKEEEEKLKNIKKITVELKSPTLIINKRVFQ